MILFVATLFVFVLSILANAEVRYDQNFAAKLRKSMTPSKLIQERYFVLNLAFSLNSGYTEGNPH